MNVEIGNVTSNDFAQPLCKIPTLFVYWGKFGKRNEIRRGAIDLLLPRMECNLSEG